MAATSKKSNTGVAKSKAAAPKAAAKKTEQPVENTVETTATEEKAVEKTETPVAETVESTESGKTDGLNGLPFKVEDGLVTVISKKRAGKSVYGTTGDIVKFDENGIAKVKLEDALHFQQIPGFEFK